MRGPQSVFDAPMRCTCRARVGPTEAFLVSARNLFFESWAAHTTLALDTVAAQLWLLPESCRGTTFPATLFLS